MFTTQSKFYNLYLDNKRKTNIKSQVIEFVIEWLRDKHVYRGLSVLIDNNEGTSYNYCLTWLTKHAVPGAAIARVARVTASNG